MWEAVAHKLWQMAEAAAARKQSPWDTALFSDDEEGFVHSLMKLDKSLQAAMHICYLLLPSHDLALQQKQQLVRYQEVQDEFEQKTLK